MSSSSLSELQRDLSQSDSVRALVHIIWNEINSATKRRDKPEKAFVCYEDLKRIWSNQSRISTLVQLDLSQSQIDFIQRHMIRILSTLIYAGAIDCLAKFCARLFDPISSYPPLTDDNIPFEMNQLVFLDSDPALKQRFYEYQFRFKPVEIVISKRQIPLVIENPMVRLPFEYRRKNIGSGGFGEVDLVGISPRYIKQETGSSWESVLKVACKKIRLTNDFDKEVDNLRILKDSLIDHDSIMLHLTTIEHGPNRYILLPYAEYGDLEVFLQCGVGPDRREKYNFNKYFPEVRNGNITHHLLRQCWSLANALELLHSGIPNRKTSSIFFCAHMDLKPANILIQPDPDSAVGKWVISDFGISVLKEMAQPQDSEFVSIGDYISQLTMNTQPKRDEGTYQAPEVKLNQSSHLTPGQKGIGRKSDIWSYGCIFSEVLAFALGRDKYVNDFHSKQKVRGGKYLFYVEKADQEYLRAPDDMPRQYQVHPFVIQWLDDLCGRQSWVDSYVETIKKILIVDAAKRPDATELTKLVNHVKEQVNSAQVNCSIIRARDGAVTQRTLNCLSPTTSSLGEDPNTMSRGNQSPPLDCNDFILKDVHHGVGDRDLGIRHSDDASLTHRTSANSQESSGTYSLTSMMSVRPANAHGIVIDSDAPRTANESKRMELPRPEGPNFKATHVALTDSSDGVYAAYLSKSLIYLYKLKLDAEEMSARLEPPLELPHPNGWKDITLRGLFLAAWGFSSNRMLYLCNIHNPQRRINLPSLTSLDMLDRVVVSEQGAAALLCGGEILVVNFRTETLSPPLRARDDQKFTDAAFNDTGDLLFAWAYGQKDTLYVWRCQDCVVNERSEFETVYNTVKPGDPYLIRVIPYNSYPGCIIATPNKRFFAARVRRRTSVPEPRTHSVEAFNAGAVCVFRDHSMITVEKKLVKEYKIEYEDNHILRDPGVNICKLKSGAKNSSRLLVIEQNGEIIVIVCNLNKTVDFVKIVPT